MSDNSKKTDTVSTTASEKANPKKEYVFGEIKEFSLEKIEEGILEESIYLDVFAGSDLVFKENIKPIENVLSSLANLNCITYDYKTAEFEKYAFPKNRQMGVIAQDIKSAFPELVKTDELGNMQVNYSQLSTVALQAVKELSTILEKSNERIASLELEIKNLKK